MTTSKLQKQKDKLKNKYLLLKAIHEGKKHTLANSVIAPLCASGLVKVVEYSPNGWSYKKCKLTAWGITWLHNEEAKHKHE